MREDSREGMFSSSCRREGLAGYPVQSSRVVLINCISFVASRCLQAAGTRCYCFSRHCSAMTLLQFTFQQGETPCQGWKYARSRDYKPRTVHRICWLCYVAPLSCKQKITEDNLEKVKIEWKVGRSITLSVDGIPSTHQTNIPILCGLDQRSREDLPPKQGHLNTTHDSEPHRNTTIQQKSNQNALTIMQAWTLVLSCVWNPWNPVPSMMVVSSAEPDETIEGRIFTVLAIALRPVFPFLDTSIQMNPKRLQGVGDSRNRG